MSNQSTARKLLFILAALLITYYPSLITAVDAAISLKKSNFAYSTLDGGISNSAVSVVLINGSRFPQSGTFRAVLWGASYGDPALDPTPEIVNAVLSAGNTFTLARGLEGTTARAWATGDNFALPITNGVIAEWEAEIANKLDAAHIHNDVYYTEAELNSGVLNSIYYTEAELNAGVLNSIYYTEAEVDAFRDAHGESVLGGGYTISAASDVWADTGLSVALPGAGTYVLYANVRYRMQPNGMSLLQVKLYDATGGVDVSNSDRQLVQGDTSATHYRGTSSMQVIFTADGAKTINLYVKRVGTFTTSDLQSDTYGRTNLGYVRVE